MARQGSKLKLLGLNTKDDRIVPLKSVWVDINIKGYVAEVASTLTYYNEENDPVEATFTFPVDDGSAVFQFEAEIQGRHIKAEIQEKQQAQQTYEDAVERGKTAMLLKEDNSTGDIFNCMLGNLPPKCEATLVMKYVLDLPQEPDGKIRFTLPTVLNPRYSPDVGGTVPAEGATYVPPNRIPYEFKMAATIQGYYKIVSVMSEKCMLDVNIEKDRNIAKVCLGEKFKFDHDLQFLVQYEEPFAPQVVLERGNSQAAGLLKEDILMVSFHPNLEQVTMATGGEYIFIIDRSGSMRGPKIQDAKQALVLFLKSLPTECYFNIVSFGSDYTTMFTESKGYSQQTLEEALQGIEKMNADMGGTEIYPALKEVFDMNFIPKCNRSVFILTDGEVSNTYNVIALVGEQGQKPQSTRVFSLGIGEGASTALVNGIARKGNGKADFVRSGERIQAKVMSLLKCAMQPSVTKLSLSWNLPQDVTPISIPTEYPTLISAGERLTAFAILQSVKKPLAGDISGTLTLRGEQCGNLVEYKMKFTSSETDEISVTAPVHRLATKTQIKFLEDSTDDRAARQKITDLSLQGNVVSKFTAFVAIDAEGKKVDGQPIQRQCPVAMMDTSALYANTVKQCSLSIRCNSSQHSIRSIPQSAHFFRRFNSSEQMEHNGIAKRSESSILPFHYQQDTAMASYESPIPEGFSRTHAVSSQLDWASKKMKSDVPPVPKSFSRPIPGETPPLRSHVESASKTFQDGSEKFPPLPPPIASRKLRLSTNCSKEVVKESKELTHAGMDFVSQIPHGLKVTSSTENSPSDDNMLLVVAQQKIEGFWEVSTHLLQLLDVTEEDFNNLGFSNDSAVVCTVVVLCWLRKNLLHRQEEWQMIEAKAISWLGSKSLDIPVEDLIKKTTPVLWP